MAQEMKSPTFKRIDDEDHVADVKYFWAKTRHAMDKLKLKGYTIDLTETAANVLYPHQPERDRQQPEARTKRATRKVSEG